MIPLCTYWESVHELDLAAARQRAQALDHRGELHAIVGGGWFAAVQLFDVLAGVADRRPSHRGPGCPCTPRPVKISMNAAHAIFSLRLAGAGHQPLLAVPHTVRNRRQALALGHAVLPLRRDDTASPARALTPVQEVDAASERPPAVPGGFEEGDSG